MGLGKETESRRNNCYLPSEAGVTKFPEGTHDTGANAGGAIRFRASTPGRQRQQTSPTPPAGLIIPQRDREER